VQHGNEADDSLKQPEETRRLNTESPQPADKLEREKVSMMLSKIRDTLPSSKPDFTHT